MNQSNSVKKEKSKPLTDANLQRRRFSRLVTVSPVLISLVSKSALGRTPYHCSVSGTQSGNTSNPQHDTTAFCNVGYSPTDWRDDAPPGGSGALWSQVAATPSTQFSTIFGNSDNRSFYYILDTDFNAGGLSLESHAIIGYLNALLANSGDISLSPVYDNIEPSDIIGLYQVATGLIMSYTTSSGLVIDATFDVLNYLISIHQ